MDKRNAEFVLGLLGGIFGFGTGFFGFFFSFINDLGSSVAWVFILSVMGIMGSIVVKFRPKMGGIIMLISGIGILISSFLFGLLPFTLLFIAGLMGLIRKGNIQNSQIKETRGNEYKTSNKLAKIEESKKEGWFKGHKIFGLILITIFLVIFMSFLIGLLVPSEKINNRGYGLKTVNEGTIEKDSNNIQTSSESNSKIKTIGEVWINAESCDADSNIDGLHFYLEPKDSEGGIVKIDGVLKIKLWKLECTEESEWFGCVEHTCTKKDKDLIETWSIHLTKADFSAIFGAEIKAEYNQYSPLTSASSTKKLGEQGCAEVSFITSEGDRFSSLDDIIFLSG